MVDWALNTSTLFRPDADVTLHSLENDTRPLTRKWPSKRRLQPKGVIFRGCRLFPSRHRRFEPQLLNVHRWGWLQIGESDWLLFLRIFQSVCHLMTVCVWRSWELMWVPVSLCRLLSFSFSLVAYGVLWSYASAVSLSEMLCPIRCGLASSSFSGHLYLSRLSVYVKPWAVGAVFTDSVPAKTQGQSGRLGAVEVSILLLLLKA